MAWRVGHPLERPVIHRPGLEAASGRIHDSHKDGFKQYNYMVGYLDHATSPSVHWPLVLAGGSSYLIVGVCDTNCGDFDLALEDVDGVVIASDTAADAFPRVSILPSTTVTYWVKPTMHVCRVNPCGYGIGVFTTK
jgi:hypothetical protein